MRIPGGVILLAILSIVGGVFGILWGMAVGGLGGMTWLTGAVTFSETIRSWGGSRFLGGLLGICGGLFQIIVGFGLIGGRSWAWWLAAVAAGIMLIHPLVGLFSGNLWSIFGLIVPGLIFYYLTKADVRQAFKGMADATGRAERECRA